MAFYDKQNCVPLASIIIRLFIFFPVLYESFFYLFICQRFFFSFSHIFHAWNVRGTAFLRGQYTHFLYLEDAMIYYMFKANHIINFLAVDLYVP